MVSKSAAVTFVMIVLLLVSIQSSSSMLVSRELPARCSHNSSHTSKTYGADFGKIRVDWANVGWLIHYDWGFSAFAYFDQDYFYYKMQGGSSAHFVYISTSQNSDDGYPINGMFANYVLSTTNPQEYCGDGGLFKWNSTSKRWMPIAIANIRDEQLGMVSLNHEVMLQWSRGQVALSAFGSPKRIWVVFRALESSSIYAPQNGYASIDFVNRVGFVFTIQQKTPYIPHPSTEYPPEQKDWVINRTQFANATFTCKNYGHNTISNVCAQIEAPPEINIQSGNLTWNVTALPNQFIQRTTTINRTGFGTSQLKLMLSYTDVETQTQLGSTFFQNLTMVPSVNITFNVASNQLLGESYRADIMVENRDPLVAPVTLVPAPLGWARGETISVDLPPHCVIAFHPLLPAGTQGYAVVFEGITLATSYQSVRVGWPEIYLLESKIECTRDRWGRLVMEMGCNYVLTAVIINTENVSCTATYSVKLRSGAWDRIDLAGSDILTANCSSRMIALAPHSNVTVATLLIPLNQTEPQRYEGLVLAVEVDGRRIREDTISFRIAPPQPWYAPLQTPEGITAILLTVFVGLIVGLLLFVRRSGKKTEI